MSTRRARRRAARRQEIVDAAMALVLDDGLDGLTIARLAKEVDAAVGAIYRYFDGKEAVIVELQLLAVQRLVEQLEERLSAAEGRIGELPADARSLARIMAAFATWPAFSRSQPALYRLVDRSVSDPRRILTDEQAAKVEAEMAPVLLTCGRLLQEAVESGALEPGDPSLRSHALWAAFHGVGHFEKRDGRGSLAIDSASIRRELLDVLLRGWGASKGAVTAARTALA